MEEDARGERGEKWHDDDMPIGMSKRYYYVFTHGMSILDWRAG